MLTVRRIAVLVLTCAILALLCFASLAIGSSHIPLANVWHLLLHPDGSGESYNVNGLRLQRTVVGVLVGVALAVAGAVMQVITRNPMADPGLLGVNSGASLAIVVGACLGSADSAHMQFLRAAVGAAGAATLVYFVGGASHVGGASPVRLVLAGAAFSAASGGVVSALLLLREDAFQTFRYWDVGALTRNDVNLWWFAVPLAAGLVIIFATIPQLSNMALGDDVAAALGTDVVRTRGLALVGLTLLCAAATAIAGPISFVGLMVPLWAGWLMGSHLAWTISLCLVFGPCLMLTADILGRVIARPSEIPVGVLTAFVGAPFLFFMATRMKTRS